MIVQSGQFLSTNCLYLVYRRNWTTNMETVDIQKRYNLSREAAGKLLKVSVRTLDRYLKAKKVSSQIIDGRIWLDKDEIEAFRANKNKVIRVDTVSVSTSGVSIDDNVDKVDNSEVFSQDSVDPVSTKHERPRSSSNETYKNLFLELKEELNEKQERLEIANYRVGQLEAQLRSSIPLLEYHREKYENKKVEEEFETQLSESANMLKRLSLSIKYEKFSKRIFVGLLLIVLALQPLWLFFYFNN